MTKEKFEQLLPGICATSDIDQVFEKLDKLAQLVEEKSKEINITAIRDYDAIWSKHIIDSLHGNKFIEEALGEGPLSDDDANVADTEIKILDLGTGGGFPGLPLSIVNPEIKFSLLDSTKKKIGVVQEFIDELDLKNVETIWGRAEEISGDPENFEQFDGVVTRAVAYLPDLIGISAPFLKNNGYMAHYKQYSEKELQDASEELKNGSNSMQEIEMVDAHRYKLDGDETDRVILVYRVKSKSNS